MPGKSRIIGLVAFISLLGCVKLSGQKEKVIDYVFYAGMQRKFIHGSGIEILDPQLKDVRYPYSDSIGQLPNFSFHSGVLFSTNIVNNFCISLGLEWNLRRSYIQLYGDSISSIGNPLPSHSLEHNLSHNLEIPLYISFFRGRLGVGGGVKVTLLEFRTQRLYSKEEEIANTFTFAYFPKPLAKNILYPILFSEYSFVSDSKFPLWLRVSYEFDYSSISNLYISLRTEL